MSQLISLTRLTLTLGTKSFYAELRVQLGDLFRSSDPTRFSEKSKLVLMDTDFFIQYFFRKSICRNFTVVTNSNLPLLLFLHPDGILFKILKFDITVIRH